jgi:hypothetical protein
MCGKQVCGLTIEPFLTISCQDLLPCYKGGFNDVNTFYHVKYRYLQAENRHIHKRSAKIKEFLNVNNSKI